MMRRCLPLLLLIVTACGPHSDTPPRNDVHVAAARFFTRTYSRSRFTGWHVHARAAGRDCDVLLVSTSIVLDDSMVEGLHYGGGYYGVMEGGVRRFCRERKFRGVTYTDSSTKVWTYGVTPEETPTLKPCD